jgi:hypothetical protein
MSNKRDVMTSPPRPSWSDHDLKTRTKPWSRRILPLLGAILLAGCAGPKLIKETESGGVVTYPFGENGYMTSPFRKEAIQIIEKKCGKSYKLLREGETRAQERMNTPVQGAEEVIRQRRWGIEFECKKP